MKKVLNILLCVSFILMIGCNDGGGDGGDNDGNYQIVEGLIANYSFDELLGNTARDESGLFHDGRISAASRVNGYFGEGLLFGFENSHIRLESILTFVDGLITIEAWINPAIIEAGKVYRIIGGYNYHELYFQIRDGKLEVLYEGQSYHFGNVMIQSGVWTHIAFTSDGTDIVTYINGVEDARTNITLPIQNFLNIHIGASYVYTGGSPSTDIVEEFPGVIDELRIWDTARTQAEISDNRDIQMVNPKSATIDIAYWAGLYPFDEVAGNVAHDYSGLNNHGTIFGASRVAGHSGNGLLFGADDARVEIANSVLFFDGLIAIGAWINPAIIEAGKVYRIIGSYNYGGLYFQIRDGRLEVLHEGQSYHFGNVMIQSGVWTYIEFTSNGADIVTYINGVEDARTNITLPIKFFSNISIGANRVRITGGYPLTDIVEEFPGVIDQLEMVEGVLAFN